MVVGVLLRRSMDIPNRTLCSPSRLPRLLRELPSSTQTGTVPDALSVGTCSTRPLGPDRRLQGRVIRPG